jgi:cytochrome c5
LVASLIHFATSEHKPVPSPGDLEFAMAARLQKVGSIQLGQATHELKTGEQVFQVRCSACHGTGAAGSPKFGDASAWGPRIKSSFDSLLNSALHGKGNMSPQGGGDLSDLEIARGVVYMANAGGGKFPEPKVPAAEEPKK